MPGAVILMMMASCSVEPLPVQEPEFVEQYLVFSASAADSSETKTVRQSDGAVWWTPADEISIFYARGNQGGNKFTSINTEPTSVTDFTGTIGVITGGSEISPADTYFWALYPYDPEASCDGGSITTTLGSVQEATPRSFADHVNIAIARSRGLELSFYNVCGGFKFSVTKNQVNRVRIRGNNGEILAGEIKVALGANEDDRPEIQSVTNGQTELILEAPEGEFFETGTPYMAVSLPVAFPAGFTVTFETPTESADFVYNDSYTLKRSKFVTKLEMDAGLEYHLRHVASCEMDTDVVDAAGGEVHVTVAANADFTLDIPAETSSWLAVSGNEGTRPETLVFTVQANESINNREAKIVLRDAEQNAMGEIIIRQSGNRINGLLEVHVPSIGELDMVLSETGYAFEEITAMKVTGVMNDVDFLTIYYDMPSLTYLDLSEVNITKLPNKSFYKATNVKQIILPQSLKSIGTSAFAESVIEEVFCYNNIESIGNHAFANCIELRSINFEEHLTTIESNAFESCSGLTSLSLPSTLTTIGDQAFKSCQGLTELGFPEIITSIGKSAFEDCTNLGTIHFSAGCHLTSLQDMVFRNCPIKELVIPAKVSSISLMALNETNLEKVDFESGSELTIMDRYFPMSLRWIKIPANVITISKSAFSYSDGDAIIHKKYPQYDHSIPDGYPYFRLTTVLFEAGSKLQVIEGEGMAPCKQTAQELSPWFYYPYGAFAGCKDLESIIIPSSVTTIEAGAFAYCEQLSDVSFEANAVLSKIPSKTAHVKFVPGTVTEDVYVSPFFCCNSLGRISLPSSVTVIEREAFKYCQSLSVVELEDDSHLTSIHKAAFYGLSRMTAFDFPNELEEIGEDAFYNTPLVSVDFGGSLERIGKNAFSGDSAGSIIRVSFANCSSLIQIGEYAFAKQGFSSVSFPASLVRICSYAFSNCSSLRTVVFAENSCLTEIKEGAFIQCPTIRRFDARNCTQVSSVGSKAFANSDVMQAFYIGTPTAPTCAADAFGNVGSYSVLKVPDESVNSYANATGWKNFSSITGFNEGL